MILINYTLFGIAATKQFDNTLKGNRESVIFIQGLKDTHTDHPYFLHLNDIKTLRAKISTYERFITADSTYMTWRSKSRRLETARDKYLRDEKPVQPAALIVQISTI